MAGPRQTVVLPDGRRLFAIDEGPTGNWVLYLEGAEHREVAGRWLLVVLNELLRLPRGPKPEWVLTSYAS